MRYRVDLWTALLEWPLIGDSGHGFCLAFSY